MGQKQIYCGIRNIATFFDLVHCFGFHGQETKTLYFSKLLQKQATLRNLQQNLWNPQQILRNSEQFGEI